MKKILTFTMIVFLVAACSSSHMVKMTTYENHQKVTYKVSVPLHYTLKKIEDDRYKEIQLLYDNGAVFYITDDEKSGGAINKEKVEHYGNNVYIRIATSDTLDINGTSKRGIWREKKIKNIVLGYINATKNQKKAFDKTIASIKKK